MKARCSELGMICQVKGTVGEANTRSATTSGTSPSLSVRISRTSRRSHKVASISPQVGSCGLSGSKATRFAITHCCSEAGSDNVDEAAMTGEADSDITASGEATVLGDWTNDSDVGEALGIETVA